MGNCNRSIDITYPERMLVLRHQQGGKKAQKPNQEGYFNKGVAAIHCSHPPNKVSMIVGKDQYSIG
ncbi:MAG: hypothetical protein VYC91_05035 [Acidobacteriota bacterium]|nr:hypothetical protein [Acidobacteriota bacterium]